MKNLTLLSFILFAVISCNKEKSADPCKDNSLIRQVRTGNQTLQEFNYNGNCQVYESIEPYIYTKYSYEQSSRLTKVEQAMSLNPASCYMPQGVAGENVSDPRKAKVSSYSVFNYDSSGRLKMKLNYFVYDAVQLLSINKYEYLGNRIAKLNIVNPNDELIQYHLFVYDDNGNLVRDDYYLVENGNEATLANSSKYEFDARINPFSIFANSGEPGIKTNTNNIIKETTTYYNAGNEYQNIIEYLIEYNPAGYPIKVNDKTFLYGN